MKTFPTKEPVALIHGLDLKSPTLNRVIIAHMLWEICTPPPHCSNMKIQSRRWARRLLPVQSQVTVHDDIEIEFK